MTRLKALLKKADKAAVIGMTAAAVAMAALGAGGVKTYASDYSVQKYVDSSDESLVLDGDTWHCYKDGQIDYDYDGIALNEYGWWYFENGLLNEEYTGIGANSYGEWYYQQGRIGYDFSGKVKFDDTEYTITEGYVVEKRIVNETEADTADTVHTAGTLPAGEESSTLGK